MTGLFHYFHHFVKGYTVITVCKGRIDIGIKSSGRCIGISFDTTDGGCFQPPLRLWDKLSRSISL